MITREKIIKAAVTLFIKQGIAKTTTKQIATRAHVSEGSIYRHFPSKEELAWQVFRDYHAYIAQQLQDSLIESTSMPSKIEALVGRFLKVADEDWLMFSYYLTSQHTYMAKVRHEMLTPYRVLNEVVKQGMYKGEIDKSNVDVMTAMVMGAVHQTALNKIYSRISGDLYKHVTLVSKTVKHMLISEVK